MIEVIVPVYNAADDLARCVDSVLASTAGAYRLVLIDDASPDPAIRACFERLAARELLHLQLLRNDTNLGFTGTANRGLRESLGDVVLLNSDTLVSPGWLDALRRCAAADPTIGTITPFSNNAEICSYPDFCRNNPWPEDGEADAIRQQLARAAVPSYPDLPTGVGFCLFIRRRLIDAIGVFDPAFGHGYGEENDYCLRAAKAGFRNVLCDDAFVVHLGERSFQGRKAELGQQNMQLLLERHPEYLELVQAYIATDPLRPIRDAALALQRVADAPGRGVLHFIHGHGGGTEYHARALIAASRGRYRHYLAMATGDAWVIDEYLDDGAIRSYRFVRSAGESWVDFVGGLCASFGVGLFHLHNISGCRDGILAALAGLPIPYGYTLHDLNFACPTITFLGVDGMYCGAQTDPVQCAACLAGQAAFAATNITEWRERHRRVLARAAFLLAPSRWVAETLASYYPECQASVVPLAAPRSTALRLPTADATHSPHVTPVETRMSLPDDDIPTVAVLGAIGPDKGARRLDRLVELARAQNAPIRVVLIGYLDRLQSPWQSDDARFTVHGYYDAAQLPELLLHYRARLVLFPSACPETFSFTLSEAWASGIPVLVPPIGALAERVGETRAGWTMTEAQWRDEALMLDRIVELLAAVNAEAFRGAVERVRRVRPQTAEAMADACFVHYDAALGTGAQISKDVVIGTFQTRRLRDALGYQPWQPPPPDISLAGETSGAAEALPVHVGKVDAVPQAVPGPWVWTTVTRVLDRWLPARVRRVFRGRMH